MNAFEKILYYLQGTMEEPKPWGWFHLMWITLAIITLIFLYTKRKNYSDKQLKIVLAVYGIIALILEVTKQLIWSFNYDPATGLTSWSYQWYAAPFQLCTTPIFVSLICLFLKKGKLRDHLLSYMAYFTILGSISTILLPDSCFVKTIEVNIHTMFLHVGSFVVSVYLMMSGEVKPKKDNFFGALKVFTTFVFVALLMDVIVYKSGILNGETFNMFYISPYFTSVLPVFDKVQESVPYVVYLVFYIFALTVGASIIYSINLGAKKLLKK